MSYTVTGSTINYAVTRRQLEESELASAVMRSLVREMPCDSFREISSIPHRWDFKPSESSQPLIDRGWMTEDGEATALGRCINEYHRNYSPESVYSGDLFDLRMIMLSHAELDADIAKRVWTVWHAEVLTELYDTKEAVR